MRRTGTRRGTRFSRRARRQISATEQTRVATTEAIPTPANGTRTETQCETDVTAGTDVVGHARQQIPAPEQTLACVASISETSPTLANGTRTETDTTGTRQGSSQPGDQCQSAHYGKNNEFLLFFKVLYIHKIIRVHAQEST